MAGKSAQFPLHSWLPDAMAGPTPVSALIHAATMVAAGIYFVARLLPVFAASPAALVVLALMAAVTMVGSALAALAQDDIKRVLAYSTISQLGYMAGALAVGDRDAAVFHLLTHGAFKALLFLAAGVVIHAAGTNSLTAMSRMGGMRKRAPDAFWTMTIALAGPGRHPAVVRVLLQGVRAGRRRARRLRGAHPAFAGAPGVPASAGWTVLVAGLLTALLTAAYAARLWLLAFPGGCGSDGAPPAPPTGRRGSGAATTGGHPCRVWAEADAVPDRSPSAPRRPPNMARGGAAAGARDGAGHARARPAAGRSRRGRS